MRIAILGGTGKLGLALDLLLAINKANKVKDSGIKITGI